MGPPPLLLPLLLLVVLSLLALPLLSSLCPCSPCSEKDMAYSSKVARIAKSPYSECCSWHSLATSSSS
jgi:hypothetical protein